MPLTDVDRHFRSGSTSLTEANRRASRPEESRRAGRRMDLSVYMTELERHFHAGIDFFNRGEFFESHEEMEEAMNRRASEPS